MNSQHRSAYVWQVILHCIIERCGPFQRPGMRSELSALPVTSPLFRCMRVIPAHIGETSMSFVCVYLQRTRERRISHAGLSHKDTPRLPSLASALSSPLTLPTCSVGCDVLCGRTRETHISSSSTPSHGRNAERRAVHTTIAEAHAACSFVGNYTTRSLF